ncbi:MAG TPA: hypothetical protein VFD30_11035 [Terriglobia bacterium]|nr:hypothetical protein [Terriglobia bacterium]
MENYFNYFTEIEECFRRCRGTPSLLSPLDWALIESWKEAQYPLEAVLAGIERAFEKYHSRPRRFRLVNSLAYCSQEVLRAVEEAQAAQHEAGPVMAPTKAVESPFTREEVVKFIEQNAEAVEKSAQLRQGKDPSGLSADLRGIALVLREAATNLGQSEMPDLEELENHLTVLEDKLMACLLLRSSNNLLGQIHKEIQAGLVPYRRRMSVAQITSLERQFLKKSLFDHYGIPRLSLFYL